jgi:3-methylcrotonyl-CoA carboxylase alpha subunit
MELIARLEDGSEERIDLERDGEGYRVAIGERTYRVDLARFGQAGRSLLIGGRQHEVMVRAVGGGRYEVGSPRGLDVVEVVDPLTHLARQAHGGDAASGGGRVTAYMPGRVVGLLVEEGASVTAGQGVLVLEAMKMENEIAADHAGVVKRFFVEPGRAVESGDPLFEIG